jgi:hypothetical protein
MRANQFFNFDRFCNYTTCAIISNYRQIILFWGAVFVAIFFTALINSKGFYNNNGSFMPIFLLGFYISGLLYSGFSFKAFRSKERTVTELMIPVSTFERFIYEFVNVVSFWLIFPIVFFMSKSLAFVTWRIFFNSEVLLLKPTIANSSTNGLDYGFFISISGFEPGFLGMIFMISVSVFALAFAGAATFRKAPLIKTIVFVGSVLLSIIGYLYLIFEKCKLQQSWISNIEHNVTAQQGFQIGTIIFAFISLVALLYTYFKLKEKEAS